MEKESDRAKQTVKFLKWTQRYSGWWYLICTPGSEEMNPQMMKMLIERLAEKSLYEIIFVLIMVHRNEPFVDSFIKFMLLDMLVTEWEDKKDEIIKKLIDHLE